LTTAGERVAVKGKGQSTPIRGLVPQDENQGSTRPRGGPEGKELRGWKLKKKRGLTLSSIASSSFQEEKPIPPD